jgi:hypothetical protein
VAACRVIRRRNHADGGNMSKLFCNLFLAVLFAATIGRIGLANAADGCGPGCHSTERGGCVVDGWGTRAPVWNECPAGARPHPPCGAGYVWRPRFLACFEK